MTRTQTISIDYRQNIGKFPKDLARFFVVTDSGREAEAVESARSRVPWGALPGRGEHRTAPGNQ